MRKNPENMESDVLEAVEDALAADKLCEDVVAALGIEFQSEVHRNVVIGAVKSELREHIEPLVLRNLDDEQARLLGEFIESTRVAQPDMDRSDVIVVFALMYPKLRARVVTDFEILVKEFVLRFRQLNS